MRLKSNTRSFFGFTDRPHKRRPIYAEVDPAGGGPRRRGRKIKSTIHCGRRSLTPRPCDLDVFLISRSLISLIVIIWNMFGPIRWKSWKALESRNRFFPLLPEIAFNSCDWVTFAWTVRTPLKDTRSLTAPCRSATVIARSDRSF